MPQVPGVHGERGGNAPNTTGNDTQRVLQIGGLAAVAVLLIGFEVFWWARNRPAAQANTQPPASEAAEAHAPRPASPAATDTDGRILAATTEEVSKPWSWKKFTFVRPFTNENIAAIVIRLPGGELWAFALQEPYGRCELEFVTDLDRIASQYGYRATHPMVGNPCNGTLYDPLKVGSLSESTWVRGEIVKGTGVRPPISIDVTESGSSVIADRIE